MRSDVIFLGGLGLLLIAMLVATRLSRLDSGKARDRRKEIERRTAFERRMADEAFEGAERRKGDRRNPAHPDRD